MHRRRRSLPPLAPALLNALVASSLAAQVPDTGSARRAATTPLRLGGYLQARETYQRGAGLTGSINRARLSLGGGVSPDLTFRIQGEFRTGSVGAGRASASLQDAYVRLSRGRLAIQAGQFKTPFGREFVTSLPEVETPDRAAVTDSLAPKRDIGVMGEYGAGGPVMLSAGVFNGEGVNVAGNRDSTVLGVARLVLRPTPAVALGLSGAEYFGDSTRYGVDLSYEGARLTLRAEYLGQARGSGGRSDDGWYGLAAYRAVEEVQFVGKYEEFTRRGAAPASETSAWTGGINVFLLPGAPARVSVHYVSRRAGAPSVRRGLLLAQVQVKF